MLMNQGPSEPYQLHIQPVINAGLTVPLVQLYPCTPETPNNQNPIHLSRKGKGWLFFLLGGIGFLKHIASSASCKERACLFLE